MIIGIRADASPFIGMGHVMRCLALADEFRGRGHKVVFFTLFELGERQIKNDDYEVIKIPFSNYDKETFFYDNTESIRIDEKNFCNILQKNKLDLLIIDTYNIDKDYFLRLKNIVKTTVYIDDINAFPYPVDIIINGNISASYMDYDKYNYKTKFLLGTKYTILRSEFRNTKKVLKVARNKQIMITTGGSDLYNMSEKIARAILNDSELDKYKLNIVVGKAFTNIDRLLNLQKNFSNVNLYWTYDSEPPFKELIPINMSEIMLNSDIAFSSSGSTIYELCACGCTILNFILADNQESIADIMSKEQCSINLGWYFEIDEDIITKKLKYILSNKEWTRMLKLNARNLVDGLGVIRIVDYIENNGD